ncbi:YDG/SRA domain-containing protein [Streptomyces sp. NPDC048362]|uniref:YDG/SRA domain-containing protein n=1 Tax=Streptomyces sp. NPDC048362 TaxID=3365539 RepID=UPI0037216294
MAAVIILRQYGAMGERVIGHIDDIVSGAIFRRRTDVRRAKLHGETQRGISRLKDVDGSYVSDAIVLNGGYEDDQDDWVRIKYTGASPDKDKARDGRLLRSQSWDYRDNAALKLSFERSRPIRIIRGPDGDARYSLPDDYRYDGLYRITETRTAISKSPAPDGSQIEICQFLLERLPEPQQELTAVERQIASVLVQQQEALDPGVEAAAADPSETDASDVERFPVTRAMSVQRIVRDAAAARRIKELYEHECQVCGLRLVGPDDKAYSEGAHIRPLGKPHNGPDVERNILCLCPNCHVRLDIGAIVIEDDWSIVVRSGLFGDNVRAKLNRHKKHRVHEEYVRYHRNWWRERGGPGQP